MGHKMSIYARNSVQKSGAEDDPEEGELAADFDVPT
jgi:hypothetical protein